MGTVFLKEFNKIDIIYCRNQYVFPHLINNSRFSGTEILSSSKNMLSAISRERRS